MNARILKKLTKRVNTLHEQGLWKPYWGESFVVDDSCCETRLRFDRKHQRKFYKQWDNNVWHGTIGFGDTDYWGEWDELDAWSLFLNQVEDKSTDWGDWDYESYPPFINIRNPSHAFKLAYENGVISHEH